MQPLQGITVVSLEQAVAAPLATRHLADLGARVIKVERPDGGDFARAYDSGVRGMASHFVWLNRGKESLTLNLKHPEGRDILARLVAGADVFLQNLAPGSTDRLGFDAATLTDRHPRLVVCDMSGYGATGPYRDKRAYDLLVQSETALVSVTGTPEHPSKTGVPAADIGAGMYAFSTVLAALLLRERTGRGTALEITMFDALTEWMGHPLYLTQHTGKEPPRVGLSHPIIAPYDAYPTGDGGQVVIGIQNDREWVRLATHVLERPELATDPEFATNQARVRNRARVDAAVTEGLAKLAREEAVDRLEEAGIANARLRGVHELIDHDQLVARDRWREIDSPVGRLPTVLPPMNFAGTDPALGPVPDLGEHTEPILSGLGYADVDVARLRDEQVI
ncbi:MAG: CoA transferase [Streptosporangiales bacterium]|nr:CoA transferase [Streptosporangiales bacterium]